MTIGNDTAANTPIEGRQTPGAVFAAFLMLGLTSFGGPIAHLGYFRAEFVERRRWLDDRAYADLVALCQFLPGPASSQAGFGIGMMKAGLPGALAAFVGFTLPSAVLMIALGLGIATMGEAIPPSVLRGLKVVAVAVVAQAVWGMARSLTPDAPRIALAVAAAAAMLAVPWPFMQLAVIAAGALAGLYLLPRGDAAKPVALDAGVSRSMALTALALFVGLLFGLPLLAALTGSHAAGFVEAFYRAGALVFGGGHVVLPLLEASVVRPGWVSEDAFLAGYGAAQAVPGPLFTFAGYLGAVAGPWPNGVVGGVLALAAVFLPGFLVLIAALPYWSALRHDERAQAALKGVNAAVVGLLLAAFVSPVVTSAILTPLDALLAVGAFVLLVVVRMPPWAVVALVPLAAAAIAATG
jgi:chromate transporter